jgi:hypothetical protein
MQCSMWVPTFQGISEQNWENVQLCRSRGKEDESWMIGVFGSLLD